VLYYFLPNGKVPAKPMLRAAVFAGALTEVAKYLYIWSLPLLNFQEAYGPFHVSITLLLWAFLASLILLIGAHATAVPATREAVI
jgi:membrane protein/epoxyqueuosine reductase